MLIRRISGLCRSGKCAFAIKHFVFDTGRYTLREYTDMLRADWNGFEVQRREAAALDYWGADSPKADETPCGWPGTMLIYAIGINSIIPAEC